MNEKATTTTMTKKKIFTLLFSLTVHWRLFCRDEGGWSSARQETKTQNTHNVNEVGIICCWPNRTMFEYLLADDDNNNVGWLAGWLAG